MSKSVTLALLVLAQVSASAVDYGGSIVNDTKFSTPASAKAMQFDDFALEQQDTAHLWARAPLSLSLPASIAAEGTLTLQYERPNLDCGDSDTQLIADLNLLTFECFIPDRALRHTSGWRIMQRMDYMQRQKEQRQVDCHCRKEDGRDYVGVIHAARCINQLVYDSFLACDYSKDNPFGKLPLRLVKQKILA